MRTPDGTILMHGPSPYDPQKAHAYYLRTRVLKGRKKGSSYTVKGPDGNTRTLSKKELATQKQNSAERVAAIKERLHKLTSELSKRMAEARAAEAKAKKGPTTADKAEAAREAKKYRDKNKQKLKTKAKSDAPSASTSTSEPKTESVDDLKQKVAKVKDILKSAVERQRSLSSATRNN